VTFADVIVTKTDPLVDIRSLENIDNIALVMKGGQIVKDRRTALVAAAAR
jgi:imidazolonepropionase-like amidohydrolase